jgi:hypothetical protein
VYKEADLEDGICVLRPVNNIHDAMEGATRMTQTNNNIIRILLASKEQGKLCVLAPLLTTAAPR